MECQPSADDVFGPVVHGCRAGFDFTLLFEQSFFQIAPCALLLLLVPLRASQLRRQDVKIRRDNVRTVKQTSILVLAATQLALIVVWGVTPVYRTKASIPAAVLSFVASLALLYLSSIEHTRSVRPSSLINAFILCSLVFDIPQARTLWLRAGPRTVPGIFTAGLAAKATILVLEARSKRKSLFPAYRLYAPEALVSLYDRTVLWWLNPLFMQGYGNTIQLEKMYPVDADLSSEHVEQQFQAIWNKRNASSKWPLLWAIFQTTTPTILGMILPRLCLSAFKLSQPLLINRITAWLSNTTETTVSRNVGNGLVGATVCIYLGLALTNAMFKRQLHRLSSKVRAILIAAVHSKSLALSTDALSDGAGLTLITADVRRICFALEDLDQLFATPFEIAVAIYLLAREVGVACIPPVIFTVAISGASFFASNAALPMRQKWLTLVQDRVTYTAAVLGFPKVFKMLGLTDYLTERIQSLRVKELGASAHYRRYVTLRNVCGNIPNSYAPAILLMCFTLINGGHALTLTVAFTSLSLLSLLTNPLERVMHTVPACQVALTSLRRFQNYLLSEVRKEDEADNAHPREAPHDDVELTVLPAKSQRSAVSIATLEAATVQYASQHRPALKHVDLTMVRGSLTLLVGPVGCGKSTLLKAIIGETPLDRGARWVDDVVGGFAYCAQDAWLPNDTVRNLIVAGSTFDARVYSSVMDATALRQDIASFPSGDESLIGTKGVSLSGGQRQRLALARALYSRKRLLVVDDPLSGLDASTSKHVFEHVFGPNGICKKYNTTAVLATHAIQYLPGADHIVALGEDGQVVEQGSYTSLALSDGYINKLKSSIGGSRSEDQQQETLVATKPVEPSKAETAQLDLARRTGDIAVYAYYLKSIGWKYGLVIGFATVPYAFCFTFVGVWARWWAESESGGFSTHPLGFWIGIAFLLGTIAVLCVATQIWVMIVVTVPKSSGQLHRQVLHTMMRASYDFFVKTDSGVTLNRFSNDMSVIEMELSGAVMQSTTGLALCIAGAGLIAAGSEYAGLTIPFIILILYALQRFYLRTSRQLRFLDLESQAPLLTHIAETQAGATTIRAFHWQHQNHEKCLAHLDNSTRPFYLMLCIQRWLNLVLDLTTGALAVVVVAMAVTLRGSSTAGSVGVALLNILSFNSDLNWLINAWTMLETSLGAIARCKNFEASTPTEDKPRENGQPPIDWPHAGAVRLHDICASYDGDGPNVLEDISIDITAAERVGICGRSGSGKSSLILTLLRLLDNSSGNISIDGVDLSTIPRQTIRSRLTTLPQEVIILPGTLRDNLDPLSTGSEVEREAALRRVGLLEIVSQRGGLDASMSDMSLSQGQMQLFSVARMLLRKSKLVILDEMTSSVDAVTEELMMQIISEEFKGCTIIAVAHRLRTIANFDKVIVMDQGRVAEVGAPQELMKREGGWFRQMWERSGH